MSHRSPLGGSVRATSSAPVTSYVMEDAETDGPPNSRSNRTISQLPVDTASVNGQD